MPRAAQKKLSTENLKQLLSAEDISVTYPKQNEKNLTSKVWSHLSRIFVYNKKEDYIFCESCMLLITYKHILRVWKSISPRVLKNLVQLMD